jgi:hypothetical protein
VCVVDRCFECVVDASSLLGRSGGAWCCLLDIEAGGIEGTMILGSIVD